MLGRSALFELAAHRPNRWVALHHLLLALTLASIMVIVARSPVYFTFDLLLHTLLSYHGLAGTDNDKGKASKPKPPEVLVSTDIKAILPHFVVPSERLEDLMWKHPRATRGYDADVLSAILSKHPRVVAVSNLDLAPLFDSRDPVAISDPRDIDAPDDQAEADAVLDGAAAGGTQVILTFPVPRKMQSLDNYRLAWIVDRCAAGVLFAIPVPGLHRDGAINEGSMYYRQDYPSLGVVTAEVATRQKAGEHTPGPRSRLVCELAREANKDIARFMELLKTRTDPFSEHATSSEELIRENRFINHQFARVRHAAKSSKLGYGQLENGKFGIFPPPVVEEDVVLWSSDVYSGVEYTAAGEEPGYISDALVYYSERQPIARVSHAVGFLVDVLLGVALGYLFAFLWRRYAIAAAILNRVALRPARRKFVAWTVARVWLIVAIGVLPVILWLVLIVAEWWTLRGQWFNPLPIVVGMFIDGLMQSRQRAGDRHPHNLGEYVKHHLDVLLIQIPVICVAVYFLIRSH